MGENGKRQLMSTAFLLGGIKIDCGDGCTTLDILKYTELYILKGCGIWHVNSTSIKLF